MVWKLDRLGRNLARLVNTVQDLSARGVGLLAGDEGADPTPRPRAAASCSASSRRWPSSRGAEPGRDRRAAHAPRETGPTRAPGRCGAQRNHVLLELTPVVRRSGDAASVAASGLGPGPLSGHYHILYFRGADKSSLSDPAVLTRK